MEGGLGNLWSNGRKKLMTDRYFWISLPGDLWFRAFH